MNIKNAWNYLNENIIIPRGGLQNILPHNSSRINRVVNSLERSIILQIAFWIGVGCIAYMTIWIIRNIIINIANDIAADHYVHPTSYNRFSFWESVLIRKIFSGVTLLLLIIYTGVFIKVLSNMADQCYMLITNFQPFRSLSEITAAIAAITVLVYFWILLVHIVVTSWRIIYHDL